MLVALSHLIALRKFLLNLWKYALIFWEAEKITKTSTRKVGSGGQKRLLYLHRQKKLILECITCRYTWILS